MGFQKVDTEMPFSLFSPNKMLQVIEMKVPQTILKAYFWELLRPFPCPCFSHLFPAPLLLLWLELHSWYWISVMTQTKTKSSFSSLKVWVYPGLSPSLVLPCRAAPGWGRGSSEEPEMHLARTAPTPTCAMGLIPEPPKAFSPHPSGKQEQEHMTL